MSKYAGQKVRYVWDRGYGATKGKIYEACDRDHGSDWVSIVANDFGEPDGWPADHFELVETPAPKFKAGDYVRCLLGGHDCFTKGNIYKVGGIYNYKRDDGRFGVVEDDRGVQNGWNIDCFELITIPDNVPHIVAAKQAWGISPSAKPHVHANAELAATEAKRLAEANPGTEFAIYARVSGFRADKPTVVEVA
jgi:hypothetical protein